MSWFVFYRSMQNLNLLGYNSMGQLINRLEDGDESKQSESRAKANPLEVDKSRAKTSLWRGAQEQHIIIN